LLVALPFASLQTSLGLLAKDSLNWDAAAAASVFVMIGITDILVQGLLLQRLLKHFSEQKIAMAGMICEIAGYILIGSIVFIHSPVPLLIGTILFAMGDGLLGPALGGLLARGVDASSQGQVQGGNQAVQSLARIAGPLIGGAVYDRAGHAAPYLGGALIVLLGIGAISTLLPTLKPMSVSTEPSST
jgi:DHA1 family tetracycline resistance protein-like MFS transporter